MSLLCVWRVGEGAALPTGALPSQQAAAPCTCAPAQDFLSAVIAMDLEPPSGGAAAADGGGAASAGATAQPQEAAGSSSAVTQQPSTSSRLQQQQGPGAGAGSRSAAGGGGSSDADAADMFRAFDADWTEDEVLAEALELLPDLDALARNVCAKYDPSPLIGGFMEGLML